MASLIERIERLRQEQEGQREKQKIEREEEAKQLTLLKRQKEAELAAEVQLRAAPFINIINELQIIDLFKELIEEFDLKATDGGSRPAEVEMTCSLLSSSWVIDVQTGKIVGQQQDSLDACLEEIDRLKRGKDEVKDVSCFLRWDQYDRNRHLRWGGNEIAVELVKEKNDLLLEITPGKDPAKASILTKSEWCDKEKVVDLLARIYLMDTHYEFEEDDAFRDSLRR